MNIGRCVLFSLVVGEGDEKLKNFRKLIGAGIDEFYFEDEIDKQVFFFIKEYVQCYGQVPCIELIESRIAIQFPEFLPDEPFEFWLDEFRKIHLANIIKQDIKSIQKAYDQGLIEHAVICINELYSKITKISTQKTLINLETLFEEVLERHELIQQGLLSEGIPIGIPYIDEVTNGVQPGDFWALIGTIGVGKTFVMCRAAMGACNLGKKVLFIPMEMPLLQIARRNISLGARVSSRKLKMGRLSSFAMQHLQQYAEEWKTRRAGQFLLLEGVISLSTDQILLNIKEYHPDIVFIDGAYMLRGSGKTKSKWEDVMKAQEEIKQIAMNEQISFLNSYQFSKEGEEKGMKGVGYSYAIAQLASVVLRLKDEEINPASNEYAPVDYKIMDLIKGRDGETGAIRLKYNMQLTEIEQDEILQAMSEIED